MASNDPGKDFLARTAAQFATTHWSTVLRAGDAVSPRAAEALEKLCRTYWPPVYVFVRHRGFSHEQAEDLTQGFFEQLIQKNLAGRARPERGRFRNFLLKILTQFLADDRRHHRALKRGAGLVPVPLDEALVQRSLTGDPEPSPEVAFYRKWALAVLDEALDLLKMEWQRNGKADLFEVFSTYLQGESGLPHYTEMAQRVGMTEGSVRTAVHRLRQRYRELLRGVVAQTVSDPMEIDDEIRFLLQVVSR